MLTTEQAHELWERIKPIKVAMLVSHDGENLRARPMHNVQKDFDGTLWFYTKAESGKTDEIGHDPHVCVTYEDHGNECYVSLTGTASLSRDRQLIHTFWNSFVGAWFPEGKDSPNVALLRVDVSKAEYWDSTKSRMVQLFEIARANATHTKPDMGENRKYG